MTFEPRPHRFVSLGTKLAVGLSVVVLAASTFVFVELTARERKNLVDAKVTAATMVADLFAASVSAPLDFADVDAIQLEIQNVRANPHVRHAAVWSQAEGKVIAGFGDHAAGTGATSSPVRVTADAVEVRTPVIGRQKQPLGVAVLTFSLVEENAAYATSRARIFWLCAALALGTATLLVALTRRQIVRPLERLLRAARRVERGEHGPAVDISAHDEIGRLAAAFNSMNEAIFDREDRLAAANANLRELFDHMRQAILVFGEGGRVTGAHSHQAALVFGREIAEGTSVKDLLYPGSWGAEAEAFEEWLELAFSAPPDAWNEVATFAPREVTLQLPAGGEAVLELEFRRIDRGPDNTRVMLLATDETEKRRLKLVGEQYARQMAVMRRFAASGGQIFVSFLQGSRARLARCEQLLDGARGELRSGEMEELYQYFHTIKGEAHTFELMELRAHMHGLEERLAEARAIARAGGVAPIEEIERSLRQGISSAREALDAGEQVFVESSPMGRAALELVTVRLPDVERLLQLVGTRGGEVGRVALRLASRPFGELTSMLAERVPTWAEGVGKRARLEIAGGDVMVPPTLARVLPGCLVHLARNAVAHGIERSEDRELAGKSPVGVIRLTCEDGPSGPRVIVEDDGRGIDGSPSPSRRGTRAHLSPTSLSGRGVGLAAVYAELTTAEYSVSTEPGSDGVGTRFVLGPEAVSRRPLGEKTWQNKTAASS